MRLKDEAQQLKTSEPTFEIETKIVISDRADRRLRVSWRLDRMR